MATTLIYDNKNFVNFLLALLFSKTYVCIVVRSVVVPNIV